MEKMKAIVCTKYGSPDVLQLKELEKPIPKENEICIKIFATAVTVSDCIIRSGKVSILLWIPMRLAIGITKPRQPILGIVFAGEIESIGKDVKSFNKGDQVFGWDLFPAFGTYAEYKCMSEEGMIIIKPANVNFEEAAAVIYGGLLALPYLRKGNISSGQKILVYGASGAVGTSAIQLAKYYGAEVTGVCSASNSELVKSLGADKIIDYTKEDFVESGLLYDLIFDAVGKRKFKKSKKQCSKALTPNGKCISVDDGHPKLFVKDLILLKELVETGKIKPVIDRVYPFEQIVEAHEYVDLGHKKGNVVITMT
jgi:NADPH:quinone reductase-like Zn-dependent oxidoreductase